MSDLKNVAAEYLKLKQELLNRMSAEGEAYVKELVTSIFDSAPEISIIGWEAYAPYFNDGEPCEFSLHSVQVHGVKIEKGPDESEDLESLINDYVDFYGESSLASQYASDNGVSSTYNRSTRKYDLSGPALAIVTYERLKEIEFEVESMIYGSEDLLQMALGDPHKVMAARMPDGKIEISIGHDVEHD